MTVLRRITLTIKMTGDHSDAEIDTVLETTEPIIETLSTDLLHRLKHHRDTRDIRPLLEHLEITADE